MKNTEIYLSSNLKIHNYDTNKYTKFLVNDFDWKFKETNLYLDYRNLMAKKKY